MKESRMEHLTDDLERLPRMSTIEEPNPSSMRSVYPRRMFRLTIWQWALLSGLGAVALCSLFFFWIYGLASMVLDPYAPNYWLVVLQRISRYARLKSLSALTGLLLGGLLSCSGYTKEL
jgi:hypothetical protein